MVTSGRIPRNFSIFLNPVLLACGDGVGGGSDLDDGGSELVIAGGGFRLSVGAGAVLVSIIVWWESVWSRWWGWGQFLCRPGPGDVDGEHAFNPCGDQLPRLAGVTGIIEEVYLRGQPVSYSTLISMSGISLLCRCL